MRSFLVSSSWTEKCVVEILISKCSTSPIYAVTKYEFDELNENKRNTRINESTNYGFTLTHSMREEGHALYA